eukprot:scaffold1907_cov185-Alexandrium_tamarense.AAC.7
MPGKRGSESQTLGEANQRPVTQSNSVAAADYTIQEDTDNDTIHEHDKQAHPTSLSHSTESAKNVTSTLTSTIFPFSHSDTMNNNQSNNTGGGGDGDPTKKKRVVKESLIDHTYRDFSRTEVDASEEEVGSASPLSDNKKSFPRVLHDIVSNPKYSQIICWM